MAIQKGYTVRKRNETSYEIRISLNGEKFYTTYHVPDGKKMSSSKIEQEIAKCAINFKDELKQGFRPKKCKFSEYADYVIEIMRVNGAKRSTICGYRKLLERINPLIGNMELSEITPQILNHTYQKLEKSPKKQGNAVCKPLLKEVMKELSITQKSLRDKVDIAVNTIANACAGKPISVDSANKIATALKMQTDELFDVHISEEKLSPKTVSHHAKLIGVILSQAEKEMLVKYNAYTRSQIPKAGSHEADYFETDEIIYILKCLQNEPLKWQVIIHLLIILGGRRGEIAGLRFDKIDWENKQIRLDTNLLYNAEDGVYTDTTKSTSGTRYMPLPEQTIQLLKRYKKWYFELRIANGDRWEESGFMFVQDNGKPMNPTSITSYCRKFGIKYNIDHCHPHKFRHSYASTLIVNHMDDVSLAKSLGHSRASTTKNLYGHVMDRAQERSASIIADAYFKQA
ncbi:MAG: tyrosine-type recombinase/integrase [Bacillota bacterium]|nr:tyrosine-type recombinase/integrase [Bacillota bacterium]